MEQVGVGGMALQQLVIIVCAAHIMLPFTHQSAVCAALQL